MNKPIGFIALQISLALVIVYAIYYASLWFLQRDKLVIDNVNDIGANTKTVIIAGFAQSASLANTVIDTFNPTSKSYASLPRSINRYGGAQFTYQFWMLATSPDTGYKDILLRGDANPYSLMSVNNITQETTSTEGPVIKCPRIRFNGSYKSLAIEMNTIGDPMPPTIILGVDASSGTSTAANTKLMTSTLNFWVLYTFVFRDNVQVNDFENGIEVQFYINDLLYSTNKMLGTLKQNNGNLYLFPSGAIAGCSIGDLTYYNSAQEVADITKVYTAGPPTKTNVVNNAGPIATPLFLTEYDKLDMYNS